MKKIKLTVRLNLIYLSFFIFIMIFILLVNFFLIKNLYLKNAHNQLELHCKQINASILSETDNIELLTSFFLNKCLDNNFETQLENNEINSDYQKKTISRIQIIPSDIDTDKNRVGWNYFLSPDSSFIIPYYIERIDSFRNLYVEMDSTWILSLYTPSILGEISNSFIVNQNIVTLWSVGNSSKEHTVTKFLNQSHQKLIAEMNDTILYKGINFCDYNDEDNGDLKNVYLIKNPKFNWIIIFNHPRGVFNDYFIEYFKKISIIILVLLLIVSSVMLNADFKQTRPFTEIIEGLKNSKDIRINFSGNTSDAMIISKAIDSLKNQLNQYKNALDKSVKYNLLIDNDLRLAKRLQNNILPKDNVDFNQNKSFKVFAFSEAAFDIGGDFYDFFMLDKDHLLITIADVAGKGIPASLFMIYTQTLLRSIVRDKTSVAEITEVLNNQLIEEKISDLFVTIFIGILDIPKSEFSFCNAAHNFPLLIKERGIVEEIAETHGIPIGIYPDRKYSSSTIKLEPNDQLFLYTDGLVDSHDENNMKFSVEVLKYNLMGTWFMEPNQVVDKIKDCVVSFRGNGKPEDDMTLMSIKFTPGLIQ